LFTVRPGPFWSAEAVAVALPNGALVLAIAMVFFCWLRSPPAMLTPTLPEEPSPEPLITADDWVDQLSTRLLLLNWRTSAVASAVPNTKLLSRLESEAALAMAAALSCWLPLPAATLTPTLPLAPVAELLISASLTVPWLVILLPVLLWLSKALAVAYTGILVGGGVC